MNGIARNNRAVTIGQLRALCVSSPEISESVSGITRSLTLLALSSLCDSSLLESVSGITRDFSLMFIAEAVR